MPPESMNDFFAYLTSLMTTHASMFQAVGLNMFRGFAVILIVWFGIKSALCFRLRRSSGLSLRAVR